jgi:hypothetical protein
MQNLLVEEFIMDFGLAFTFPFRDPDWFRKILIIALVALIPIIGWFVLMGWAFQIAQRVIRGDFQPLPELDFGEQLGKGFQVLVVSIVYTIPIAITTIPMTVLGQMTTNAGSDFQSVIAIASICWGFVVILYSLLLMFVLPAAIGRFASTGTMSDAFQFSEVIALARRNPVAFLLVVLGSFLAGLFITPIGGILCGIGTVLTATYSQAIIHHLIGQAYRQASTI